jgi:hypothetical protein
MNITTLVNYVVQTGGTSQGSISSSRCREQEISLKVPGAGVVRSLEWRQVFSNLSHPSRCISPVMLGKAPLSGPPALSLVTRAECHSALTAVPYPIVYFQYAFVLDLNA